MMYCDTVASFAKGRLACASPDRTGHSRDHGALLLDFFAQTFGFLTQSSRFAARLLRLRIPVLPLLQTTSI